MAEREHEQERAMAVSEFFDACARGDLGCLHGAATVGRCGAKVVPGTTRCPEHPERDWKTVGR